MANYYNQPPPTSGRTRPQARYQAYGMNSNYDNINLVKIIEKEYFTEIQNFLIENFIFFFDKKKYNIFHAKIWDVVSDISKILIVTDKINYI